MKTKPLRAIEQALQDYVTTETGVSFDVRYTGEQTRDEWQCDGWKFSLKRGQRVERFEYFTGLGHRETLRGFHAGSIPGAKFVKGHWQATRPQVPPLAGLLYSLISDAGAGGQTFATWCADFGFDTDSRKALATYEACQECADKLARLFSGAQIERIRELLQDY